ncbi:MAG: anthranilate synthase component I family protein [Phycisphaerae bacterium]
MSADLIIPYAANDTSATPLATYGSSATAGQLAQVFDRAMCDMAVLTEGWFGATVLAAVPLIEIQLRAEGNGCALHICEIGKAECRTEEHHLSFGDGIRRLCDRMESITGTQHSLPDGAGWIGYLTYEAGRGIELPPYHRTDILAAFRYYQQYYILPEPGRWLLAATSVGKPPDGRLVDDMKHRLIQAEREPLRPPTTLRQISSPQKDEYISALKNVLDYIAAGDIYQLNLCRRWLGEAADPLALWRDMYAANPGRYSAYIRAGSQAICCTSPELFLNRNGDELITSPIKGTRRRNLNNHDLDRQAAENLMRSEKEQAELAMITDLLRNDLGRVCATGSVKIMDSRRLEALPGVWQTYAVIRGTARHRWGDILAGMLPGGSITGVPKIRAMEIISELELCARGIYCGNIGWIGSGRGSFNIAIRTAIWESGRFCYAAGAGIVADSDPEMEFAEICAKARVVTDISHQ